MPSHLKYSKDFPVESGYYWCSEFGNVISPMIVYVDCSDQDAGGRRVLLIGQPTSYPEGHPALTSSTWAGPIEEPKASP